MLAKLIHALAFQDVRVPVPLAVVKLVLRVGDVVVRSNVCAGNQLSILFENRLVVGFDVFDP